MLFTAERSLHFPHQSVTKILENCNLYQMQDLGMDWISLEHKYHDKEEKIIRQVQIQRNYADTFLCPRKQGQIYMEIMMINK